MSQTHEKLSPRGGKMEPKWLQNASLEASGPPSGADPASRASPEASWRRRKIVFGGLGGPLAEKLIDFTLPGGPWEGPGGAPGGHFGSIFAAGAAGTKKARQISIFLYF